MGSDVFGIKAFNDITRADFSRSYESIYQQVAVCELRSIRMASIIQNIFSFFALNNFWSGILTGVIGSVIFAFILARIRPRVKFAKYISKRRARKGETLSGVKYLIQFWNAGWRSIIDVEISAKLAIRGLDANYPRNFTYFTIPLGYEKWPRMKKRPIKERTRGLLVMVKLMARSGQRRSRREEPSYHQTRLDLHRIQELQEPHYASFLYGKLQSKPTIRQELDTSKIDEFNLTKDPKLLEHLLELGDSFDASYIEIYISGYDSFSGTKRLSTKKYKHKDILAKDFYGKDLRIP